MTYEKDQSGIYCVLSDSGDRLILQHFLSKAGVPFEDHKERAIHHRDNLLFQCLELSILSSFCDEWKFEDKMT